MVHGDGYVELKRAYYSVPPEYVGRKVWVRCESRLLRVINQRRKSSPFMLWRSRGSSPLIPTICIHLTAGSCNKAWIICWIGRD